jgi:NAD(P)-dependent dehydrogenase (short-subunit alcohol dehydrogenase family)
VHVAARHEERLRSLGEELIGEELSVEHSALDARDVGAVERLAAEVRERHGRLDGVVNCVGSVLLKPAHLTSVEEWNSVIETNLTTSFAAVRASAKAMRGSGGSVVLMSSAAAHQGLQNHEAIAAAKAGVEGLARSSAASYARQGIRVNAVAPGLVRTPLTARITGNPAGEKASLSMHALGRLGEPSDVASMVVWLLDAENTWVTGQVFGVDGGLGALHLASR